RREDDRDDRRVSRLEVDAGDFVRVDDSRVGCRPRPDHRPEGWPQDGVALRLLPRDRGGCGKRDWRSGARLVSLLLSMNRTAYAFLGLTAIVATLIGILAFAVLRFVAALRDSRRALSENRSETAFVTAALHDALTKLKAQERQTLARAEASERLSDEIVESL